MKPKQKTNMKLVYAGAGVAALLLTGVLVVVLNVGNVRSAMAGGTKDALWEGKYSGDITDKRNWKGGKLPTKSYKVKITKGYKNAPSLGAKSSLSVKELSLEKGAKFDVKGKLEVADDIELDDKAELTISGVVEVKDHIYVEDKAILNIGEGASVLLDDDLTIEGGTVNVTGGKFATKDDIELKEEKSYFIQTGGHVKVAKDIDLVASDNKSESIIDIRKGVFSVHGITRFFKDKSDVKSNPAFKVSGGIVNLSSISRASNESGKSPANYHFEITGGEIHFRGDVIMDSTSSSKSSQSSSKKYCASADAWDKSETYKRATANEVVEVSYKGSSYRLKQNYWWSRGNQPDSKSKGYWLKVGKCGSDDPSYDCSKVKDWNNNKTYRRSKADNEYYVLYNDKIYRMHKTCWYTKGNQPDKTSWAWVEWHDCKGGGSFKDVLVHKGGTIVFHKKSVRPYGFSSSNGGIVKFKDKNTTIELKPSEQYVNVVIDTSADVKLLGTITVTGDITNNSTNKLKGTRKFKLSGTGDQSINGNEPFDVDELEIDKSSGEITINQDITISTKLKFTSKTGVVLGQKKGTNKRANDAIVIFEDNATYEGGGWFEGGVKKIGDDAFVFPTGKDGRKGYIAMTAPSSATAEFVAEYFTEESPDKNNLGTGLLRVSSLEYWNLERVVGTDNVDVTLYWEDGSWSKITDPSELMVVNYTGGQWETLGNGGTTGNTSSGTVDAQSTPGTYGYLSFGSNSSSANALPVEFIHFSAERLGDYEVMLDWSTATEENNDRFEVQRSSDGINFEILGEVQGFGTTIVQQDYSFTDVQAPGTATYYRLRQVDFNEEFDFSDIRMVDGSEGSGAGLSINSVYPNPFSTSFSVEFEAPGQGMASISISNMSGNTIYQSDMSVWQGLNSFTYNEGAYLTRGYYIITVSMNGEMVTEKISKTE